MESFKVFDTYWSVNFYHFSGLNGGNENNVGFCDQNVTEIDQKLMLYAL